MTRQTIETKERFKQEYGKYVDDIIFAKCRNQAGYMPELGGLLAIDEDSGGYNIDGICPLIFNRLHVTYEGYLSMCCADFQNYLVVADLNKEGLADAWNNEYARMLRERHLEHDLQGTLCYNCICNCASNIEPLRKEYAVPFDIHAWDKSEEVRKRIKDWQSSEK